MEVSLVVVVVLEGLSDDRWICKGYFSSEKILLQPIKCLGSSAGKAIPVH
jgi:hypothetical protein